MANLAKVSVDGLYLLVAKGLLKAGRPDETVGSFAPDLSTVTN
jgi:hypothetical protein